MPKIKVNCQECNKEFEVIPSIIKYGYGKYCSRKCFGKARSKKFKNENSPTWKGGKIKKICQECNTEFKIYPYKIKTGRGKYCSRKCKDKSQTKITGNRNPRWKPKIKKICQECNTEFEVTSYINKIKNRKYCSKKCHRKAQSKIYGEKTNNWQGGLSYLPYCEKFNKEFKERVRNFFGRRCVECQITEEENGRKLDVHHVNYDKMICCNDVKPLFVALCRKHNTQANYNRKCWQEHYTKIINEQYNGECYYSKEEYLTLKKK